MSDRSARSSALALFFVFSASILYWHRLDTRPSSMDETRHMKLAIDYRDWLAHGVPLTNDWSHVYPPVYHLSIIPALSFGMPSETKAVATHVLYLAIFIISCLLLGRSRGRPDGESVAAAALCLGYCYVFWASRRALIDFPLMAWVTLSMAMLARTKGFSNRRESLLCGVVAGMGLLIKAPFLFFSIGPLLWIMMTSARPSKMKNLIGALAVCVAISLPWYFWQGTYFLQKALSLAAEPTAPGTSPHSLSGWLFYARLLPAQMGVMSFLFTGLGSLVTLRRRHAEGTGLLIAWIVSGYVILSCLINKDPRHTLPILPAVAMVAIDGWASFAAGVRFPAIVPGVAAALLLFNMATYDRPGQEEWQLRPILALMAQRHDPSHPFLEACILSHHPRFFARTFVWSAIGQGIDLRSVSGGDADASFAEYIVTKPGDDNSEKAFLDRQWQDLRPKTRAFTELFSVCARYPLPDTSEALVYERARHLQFRVSPLNKQELERHLNQALGQWVRGPRKVKVTATSAGMSEGRLASVQITCSGCTVQKIPFYEVNVVVEKPWFNLYRLWDENRLGLLAFESLKATIRLRAEDVKSRLADVKGLSDVAIQMADQEIRVEGRYRGIPVGAAAHFVIDHSRYSSLVIVLDQIALAGIPLPGWLLGKASRQVLWTYPIPDFPGRIVINQVTMKDGELLIT